MFVPCSQLSVADTRYTQDVRSSPLMLTCTQVLSPSAPTGSNACAAPTASHTELLGLALRSHDTKMQKDEPEKELQAFREGPLMC